MRRSSLAYALAGAAAALVLLQLLARRRRKRSAAVEGKPLSVVTLSQAMAERSAADAEAAVRASLDAIFAARISDAEAEVHPSMQAAARLAAPAGSGVPASRRLLLCGLDLMDANLRNGAAEADGTPTVAHVNCLGQAAVDCCRGEYTRAGLARDAVLALEAKDIEGHPMVQRHLASFLAFVRAAPAGDVLVHCVEGRNRSATLCVAWLMVEGRLPLTAAVRYVFERRPIILTNQSFVDQLVALAAAEGLLS